MPPQFTLPPDSRAVGTGNPPADMDAVVDALAATGTAYSILNTAYAGGGDPTGTASSAAAIAAAAAAAAAVNGGIVTFPAGTFKVTSTHRADTVTYTANSLTVADASCVSGDVGSYVAGVNVANRIPQILTVNPGVSFTTDVAASTVGGSFTAHIGKPGFVLPEGVTFAGQGPVQQVGVPPGNTNPSATVILDTGTGITCLIRGTASGHSSRYALKNLSLWGQNTNTYGIFVANMSWYLAVDNCDVSYHGLAGFAFDANINSHDIRNTAITGNGSAGAVTYTGGVVVSVYNFIISSSLNFYNCFFDNNYGWGVVDGAGVGAIATCLYSCQFNSTFATTVLNSGASAFLRTIEQGSSMIVGGWSETAVLYDLITNGPVTVIGFHMHSATPYAWYLFGGPAMAIGVWSEDHTTSTILFGSGSNITWMDCHTDDPFFASGGPANISGIGSTYVVAGAGGGMSPGTFGFTQGGTIWQGSGVPSNSSGSNGDVYFRTDTPGTSSQRIYMKSAGAWVALTV
jgi:hypothetical protein